MTDRTQMTTYPHHRSPGFRMRAIACGCAFSLLALGGCDYLVDKDFDSRREAQAEFHDLANEYTMLVGKLGNEQDPLATAEKLDQLSRRITSINGASSEQKKLASNLATAMNATAGSLRAGVLETLSLDQAMLRERIAESAASAMIIAAGAETRANSDFSSTQEMIDLMRMGIASHDQDLQARIEELQGPFLYMTEKHKESTQELSEINVRIADLQQRANDAGPVDGYDYVEEASGERSKSIPIKSSIAEAESQLASLTPDLERTRQEKTMLGEIRDATDRAEENTEALHDAVVAAGNAGRQRAAAMIDLLKADLGQYQEREESEIKPLLDQTLTNLEKAGRAQGRGAAAMTAFNASRLAGDLWNLRADAAASDTKLYEMLSNAAPLLGGNPEQWAGLANEANNAHEAAIESARTEYEAALERAGSSDENQTARAAVEKLISSLDGTSIESEAIDLTTARRPPMPAGGSGAAGGGLAATMGTKGFDTPEELADFLSGLGSKPPSPQLLGDLIGASYTQDPMVLQQMSNPQAGAQMMQMMSGGGGGLQLKVASIQGDRGDLAPQNAPQGMPSMDFPIIRKNGKWLLDIDTLQERVMKMMEEAFGSMEMEFEPDSGGRGGGGGGGFGGN